jgi:N utilization substance protein B
LNETELAKELLIKLPIGIVIELLMDTIILKWPFVNFEIPSIPFKVTLNEYLELAKEYSTKSSILSTVF